MSDRNKTAYQEWHIGEMEIYRPILIDIREELRRIPRFSDHVTETDRYILLGIAKALNRYEDIKDYDLEDIAEFFKAVGILKAEVTDRLENKLRPRDPLTEAFKEIMTLKNNEAEQAIDNIIPQEQEGEHEGI